MVARSNLKPVLKCAELPVDCTPHQLRHTCATLLLSRGTHPKFVQALLVHSTDTRTGYRAWTTRQQPHESRFIVARWYTRWSTKGRACNLTLYFYLQTTTFDFKLTCSESNWL